MHEFQQRVKGDHDYTTEAQELLKVNFKEYEPKDKKVLEMPPPNISDLFSYEILHRQGGWYSDLDVAFIRPFDDLSDTNNAFVGFGGLQDWVGIFGAKAGSWVMKSFYDACINEFDAKTYNSTGSFGIIKNCTTHMQWQIEFQKGDNGDKNWRAPRDMFYPLQPEQSHFVWSDKWQTPRPMTWAVHLYGGNADYAVMNKKVCPSYLWSQEHQEWLIRYIRSLGDKKIFLEKDPENPLKNIVKEEVHDKHSLPNISKKQDKTSDISQFTLGNELQHKWTKVHNDSQQQ